MLCNASLQGTLYSHCFNCAELTLVRINKRSAKKTGTGQWRFSDQAQQFDKMLY